MPYSSLAPSSLSYFNPTYFISIMAHLYSLFDLYIPYVNFNFPLVLVLKFPGSLNLSFHNLSIHQFSRKNLSLAQFIPRIYNKIIVKILGYFWGVTLREAEGRYPKMEKRILALVNNSRKLRPYFQAHTIEVPTEYPMKKILHKPETSERLIKWAIELSEFDIKYKPRTVIKG